MSRLSQMLENELRRRDASERELAGVYDWSQQAFNTWLKGSVPRKQFWRRIANFLSVPIEDVEMLVKEAATSTGNTKLPKMDPIYGRVVDRKEGKFSFTTSDGGGMRYPLTRYAIRIDTKVMEPALLVGTRAWVDPSVWPMVGMEVLVHSKGGSAWVGRLVVLDNGTATVENAGGPILVKDVEAIHVIVLSERVAGDK